MRLYVQGHWRSNVMITNKCLELIITVLSCFFDRWFLVRVFTLSCMLWKKNNIETFMNCPLLQRKSQISRLTNLQIKFLLFSQLKFQLFKIKTWNNILTVKELEWWKPLVNSKEVHFKKNSSIQINLAISYGPNISKPPQSLSIKKRSHRNVAPK